MQQTNKIVKIEGEFQGVQRYLFDCDPIDVTALEKTAVEQSHYDTTIDYEGAFFDREGQLILLIKKVRAEDLRRGILGIKKRPQSTRLSGLSTSSIVFGYMPKTGIKQMYCSKTGMNLKSSHIENLLFKYGLDYYNIYKNSFDVPVRLEDEIKEKMLVDYFIPGTLYTSGIINNGNELAYHTDKGNYPGLFCALLIFKNKIRGGGLCIPAFGILVKAPDSTVVLFDNQKVMHGVEKIARLDKTSYRYTIVRYNMFRIKFCDHIEQEIQQYAEYRTKQILKKAKTIRQVLSLPENQQANETTEDGASGDQD